MVRYKVYGYSTIDDSSYTRKGWVCGSNLAEAAKEIEAYYGDDIESVTFKFFENYSETLIEDGYIENDEDIK